MGELGLEKEVGIWNSLGWQELFVSSNTYLDTSGGEESPCLIVLVGHVVVETFFRQYSCVLETAGLSYFEDGDWMRHEAIS